MCFAHAEAEPLLGAIRRAVGGAWGCGAAVGGVVGGLDGSTPLRASWGPCTVLGNGAFTERSVVRLSRPVNALLAWRA